MDINSEAWNFRRQYKATITEYEVLASEVTPILDLFNRAPLSVNEISCLEHYLGELTKIGDRLGDLHTSDVGIALNARKARGKKESGLYSMLLKDIMDVDDLMKDIEVRLQ